MTGRDRISYLYQMLQYLKQEKIEGDFVECGVWKGGNILGMMEFCDFEKKYDLNIWAYDTFEGMTAPTDRDVDLDGKLANNILNSIKCICHLDEFEKNIGTSSFPKDKIKIVKGDICKTLEDKKNIPEKISLLRLDTDWYESTKKELEVLYPLLEPGGVLIIDDYGHWKGSRTATDQYFSSININPHFTKIDYTGVCHIKKI